MWVQLFFGLRPLSSSAIAGPKKKSHLTCMLSVYPCSFVSVICYRRGFAKHVYLCMQVYSKVYSDEMAA